MFKDPQRKKRELSARLMVKAKRADKTLSSVVCFSFAQIAFEIFLYLKNSKTNSRCRLSVCCASACWQTLS
jgi:hypothetical protein